MPRSLRAARALVLLSGGQDSTTALYWAKLKFAAVEAINFDYGQRHRIEIEAARKVAKIAEVPLFELEVPQLKTLGGSALLDKESSIGEERWDGLPASFVPYRNIFFLLLAAAYAYQRGIHHLVGGMCQTDFSGYPDCRDTTISSLQSTLNLAVEEYETIIHTPLMWLTKAEEVRLAQALGAMEALAYSHTCYEGQYPPCGKCPACQLRAKGFAEAGVEDPLIARARKEGLL